MAVTPGDGMRRLSAGHDVLALAHAGFRIISGEIHPAVRVLAGLRSDVAVFIKSLGQIARLHRPVRAGDGAASVRAGRHRPGAAIAHLLRGRLGSRTLSAADDPLRPVRLFLKVDTKAGI